MNTMRLGRSSTSTNGFTIVELLIVIVVIGILAAITIVSYNGLQTRAKLAKIQSDIAQVRKLVEAYNAEHGQYPVTAANLNPDWGTQTARTDMNCQSGTRTEDWVPGLTAKLPQSDISATGVDGHRGCYMYVSDGTRYVISAWNVFSSPQTGQGYRRLGFREMTQTSHFYACNHTNIGGASSGYSINADYYKRSYTVSNITSCDETPPAGA